MGEFKNYQIRYATRNPDMDVIALQELLLPRYTAVRADKGLSSEHISLQAMAGAMITAMEHDYIKRGRPHYKVWEDYLPYFAETSLDFPSKYFRLPFSTFVVLFPEGQQCLTGFSASVRNVVVTDMLQVETLQHSAKKLNLSFDDEYNADGTPKVPAIVLQLVVEMSDGRQTFLRSWIGQVDSIEAAIRQKWAEAARVSTCYGEVLSPEAMDRLLRVIVSVCFLATGGDRIIEPDVLSKHLARYLEAKERGDTAEIAQLHARAIRRRNVGVGFTVGRATRILRAASRSVASAAEPENHLTYQHQRCAHLHGFHTRDGYKVRWLPQLTVRADLPVKPKESRGYAVR